MTNFEQILLKTGNPELIGAYIDEYENSLSDDFRQNVINYYTHEVKWKLLNKLHMETEFDNMPIRDFLDEYATENVTRLQNLMYMHDIKTVRDLLACRKSTFLRTRGVGKKTLMDLEDTLEKVGLKLSD